MVLFYLLLLLNLLNPVSSADEHCPGWCGNPVEEIKFWTDNPDVWRCELPSVVVLPCADEAYITCCRLDDLGGDLYLMLFADSPDDIGIDPDFLAKGRIDTLRTVIECKDGKWTLPNSTIQMTHILCDQYIINKTKAEESPFKPLPWKPEVVTSSIGTTSGIDESNEDKSTSTSSTSTTKEMAVESSKSLETTEHNVPSTTTVDSAKPESITATNSTVIELITSSMKILETKMNNATMSPNLADIFSPKLPQATTTVFLNSTMISHSGKHDLESPPGITVEHITLAMTTPKPLVTISRGKPLFLLTSTARTTSQTTRNMVVEESKVSTGYVTIAMTSKQKSAEQTSTMSKTISTTYGSTQSGIPPVPTAQKPTVLPITSTPRFTMVSNASPTKLLTTMPKPNRMNTTMGQQNATNSTAISPASNSNISTPTTMTIVTANIPQIVNVQVPTKPATGSTSTNTTKRSETPIPSIAEFESTIVLLPPATIEQLPTSQQSSRHTPSAADIILLQPDPYDGVLEPVVILEEKLEIPSRQSRSGGTKKKRQGFRKRIVPHASKHSRKIQVQKAARRKAILARPQKRRSQKRIKTKERKSLKRQHKEGKTL